MTKAELERRAAFAGRMWKAYVAFLCGHHGAGQREFAAAVGKAMGRKSPSQTTVSRWMAEDAEQVTIPGDVTLGAVERVTGYRRAWLRFGEEPKALPSTDTLRAAPRKRGDGS